MNQKKLPLALRWFYMLPIDVNFMQTFFVMYVTTSLSLIENPSYGTLRKSNNAECLGIDKTFWVLPTTVAQPDGELYAFIIPVLKYCMLLFAPISFIMYHVSSTVLHS